MIEFDNNQSLQAAQMEAAILLAEAVEKATALGFTISASGTTIDVIDWHGRPLIDRFIPTSGTIFEAQYLTNLIDWLDGVAYGRTHIK